MPGPGSYLIGREEIAEVNDVLLSRNLFRFGNLEDSSFMHKVYSLEREFEQYCSVKHAIAATSGTCAILVSLLALGIGNGDEVLVPGYTFIASISAIIYTRATPVLVNIDDSLTLDPNDIKRKITKRTKAIMVVHMLGNPCDMEKIMEIAKEHGLMVIEDCCQAAGASYKGRKVGSIGHIGCFSLNICKTITAGDGGIIVTNYDDLHERAFAIHDQGHKPNRAGVEVGNRTLIGLNFRMNEITGAVSLAQLRKIDNITNILRENKRKLKEQISGFPQFYFRRINDVNGECATILTLIFKEAELARKFSDALGTKTISRSGWHVYYNMEQIVEHKTPLANWSKPTKYINKGALPQTDDILDRAVNISVGVVDAGLGAAFGINILSKDSDIEETANKIREAIKKSSSV